MNRVVSAIRQKNCALVFGSDFLSRGMQEKLSPLQCPQASIVDDPKNILPLVSTETFSGLSDNGLIVLVEAKIPSDSEGLEQLQIAMKASGKKLRILVASKFFNRSGFPLALRLLNIQHLKSRGDQLITSLLETFKPADDSAKSSLGDMARQALFGGSTKEKKVVPTIEAPTAEFVGREAELKSLKEALSENGPAIVIHGASGVGKRWLIQQATSEFSFTQIPSLHLGNSFSADAIIGRIAMAAKIAGDDKLARVFQPNIPQKGSHKRKRPSPKNLIAHVIDTLKTDALSEHIFVISGVESTLDREVNSFYHQGMLELLIHAMLTNTLSAKIIFLSQKEPQLFQKDPLRSIKLEGINITLASKLFTAWRVDDGVSSTIETLHKQTHGHPLALRHIAISTRENRALPTLDESSEDALLDTIDDIKGLRNILRNCEKSLDETSRKALYKLALLEFPASRDVLKAFQINRRVRSALLAAGVLEQTPVNSERFYYVHPLMRRTIAYRKLFDFEVMKSVGRTLQDLAKQKRREEKHLESFCFIQAANALFQHSRAHRSCWNLDVIFCDPLISSINDILSRSFQKGEKGEEIRERNHRAVRAQIDAALVDSPNHPDALFSKLRLLQQQRADNESFQKLFNYIRESAATPDSFHREASFYRNKRVLNEVINVLEAGVKMYPENGTLLRRLSENYFRIGQTTDAERTLTKAIEIQPNMPENYSLMGALLLNQGQDSWDKAQSAFDIARSLGTPNAVHLVREAELLRAKGLKADSLEMGQGFFEAAQEKLKEAIKKDNGYQDARVTIAKIKLDIIDKAGLEANPEELESIQALLRPALKRKDIADAFIQKARILIHLKQFEDIERLLDKAYKLEKNRHELYYVRGVLYFNQEDPDRAKQSFETALNYTPPSAPEYSVYQAAIQQMLEMVKTGKFAKQKPAPSEETNNRPDEGFRTEHTIKVRKKSTSKESPAQAQEESPKEESPKEESPKEESPKEDKPEPPSSPLKDDEATDNG